jgi:hypothetical protein
MAIPMKWGIHTDPQSFADVKDLLPLCGGGAKFCIGNFNDSNRVLEMMALCPPTATFIGRDTAIDIEGGPLHQQFGAIADDDYDTGYRLGAWYANHLADRALPNGLGKLCWESGPNEGAKYYWKKTHGHMRGFLDTGISRGLRVLVGGTSYGAPRLPEFDGVDDWIGWDPIFQEIDRVNRDSFGNPFVDFNAGLYGHEGFRFPSGGTTYPTYAGSLNYTIGRFDLMYRRHITPHNWWVPMLSSEFAYGADYPGFSKPPDGIMTQQIALTLRELGLHYLQLVGIYWYDWRHVSDGTFDDYWGQKPALITMLTDLMYPKDPTQEPFVFTKIKPPAHVPPPPPPQDTVVEVGIKDPGTSWLNVRSGPGWLYSKINRFYPDDRMILSGESLANVANVEGCWVWCNGTLKDPNKKGWIAGWLLERKPY